MNVMILAIKGCSHCQNISRGLDDIDIPHNVVYCDDDLDLVKKYEFIKRILRVYEMNHFAMGTGMWIFWIIVIVAVVLVAKLLIVGSSSQSIMKSESPLEILEKRYASGEVDKDEFESMKKELEK